jgi:S-adenosylmethionine decarboxylase proenzyme
MSMMNTQYSGKHMICDIKGIKNLTLLGNMAEIQKLLDNICDKYEYVVLNKVVHQFDPIGITVLYLLSESHISIHTFPEKNYLAFDIYTCRQYDDNTVYNQIYEYIITEFDAIREIPIIIERKFT